MPEARTNHESPYFLIVGAGHEHRRLDQFVAAALAPERSRSQVARMIKEGLITLNGSAVRASCAIRIGDRVKIDSPVPCELASVFQNGTAPPASGGVIEILFSDTELLAVNKPAGIPVHPSPGHPDSTLANILAARFPDLAVMAEPDGLMRAGIVHRLDKETSGVMVVARTPFARMTLSQQFKDRSVSKVYLALVRGIVAHDHLTIARPLGRHPTERKRISIHSRKPREAVTEFSVLHRFKAGANPVTLLKAQPQTGRTHQIRVHLAASGHPCLGDALYGGGKTNSGWSRDGQALHALALSITHPRTGERLQFIAPLPDDIARFLSAGGLAVEPSVIRQWIGAN
ncbi:MAG: RluA family pseudouridine synthase [Deltaproteobacteria bacterium]|nr:RluA family pseudouridine synthase [Deltaproteobacteria bacterium]